jgi:D-3-phosphoglycerate dehydrogenase
VALVIYLGSKEGFEATSATLAGIAEVKHVDAQSHLVAKALTEADALLDASMKVRISDDMVRAAPRLKIISCATTGSDHVARKVLDERGILVNTLKEDPEVLRNITPAAELTWALLMACARKLKGAFKHVEEGFWVRESFPGIMLKGRVIGLIGCGRIGGWMARYAQAFGMTVIAYDPFQDNLPEGVERRSLEQLVGESDFISIHVHLSEQTKGMVSRELINKFKQGSIFINTSRGALTDEIALLDALASGKIAAAGVDVLDGEPDIDNHPMVKYAHSHDNLLITPHCGGFSPDAVRLVCTHAAQKIKRVLEL